MYRMYSRASHRKPTCIECTLELSRLHVAVEVESTREQRLIQNTPQGEKKID